MKKFFKRLFIWALILVIGAAVVYEFFIKETEIAFTEEVARVDDIETFYTFSGNVEADGYQIVSAGTKSKVKEWLFEEGDTVTKNDAVIRYESGVTVKSPIDGTISHLYLDVGDEFLPGTQLFRVADYAHPLIHFRVDEYDVSALKKGMKADVKVLSTGKVLEGEITHVSLEATVSGDLAFYEIELALPQDGTLPMGVTCEIIVPRQSALDVVTVSMDAIQYNDYGEPFVYRRHREGEVVETPVELGINNGTIVEIKDGLHAGETILIPPSFGFDPVAMRQQMMGGSR
ncbi:MAG: HlyD family efflux transporter periplasmic adaptor subunit [Clostridia bacterium]|nr:HlyD family efflux transporter periplasmic adaptor subunit [Clostridia bacterium]